MKLPKSKSPGDQSSKLGSFPDIETKEKKKIKIQHTLFSLALLIFILSLSTYIVLSRSDNSLTSDSSAPDAKQASAAPTPTPKLLPTGKEIYNFSHGDKVVGPKLTKVTLDPIDPTQGEEITITAHITHDSDVTSVKVNIITDNSSLPKELKLIEGDESNGTWQVKAEIKDTYNYNYYIKFDLRSSTGNYEGGLKLR